MLSPAEPNRSDLTSWGILPQRWGMGCSLGIAPQPHPLVCTLCDPLCSGSRTSVVLVPFWCSVAINRHRPPQRVTQTQTVDDSCTTGLYIQDFFSSCRAPHASTRPSGCGQTACMRKHLRRATLAALCSRAAFPQSNRLDLTHGRFFALSHRWARSLNDPNRTATSTSPFHWSPIRSGLWCIVSGTPSKECCRNLQRPACHSGKSVVQRRGIQGPWTRGHGCMTWLGRGAEE